MLSKCKRFISQHGLFPFIRLPFFPVILLITNPIRLIRTCWYACELSNGKWSSFLNFRPWYGVNSLFYWSMALNFDRFGRRGVSPFVSLGDYHLGVWWQMSLTSCYLYWRLGAILPLFCMAGWLLSHLVWLGHGNASTSWIFISLTFALLSSYFYASAFVFLNYNAVGWLFTPLGIYGLLSGEYGLAAIAWFLASLGSFTTVFVAGFLCLALSLSTSSILPVITIFPAILKLLSHFFFVEDLKTCLLRIAAAIGVNQSPSTL